MLLSVKIKCILTALMSISFLIAGPLCAQDTRTVNEPTIPPSCAIIPAPLESSPTGQLKGTDDNSAVSASETATIQTALNACAAGKAVELSLGASGTNDAFLINPLDIPAGASLIVDGGVTVFGSADPANYQTPGASAVCGVIGPSGGGCRALLDFTDNSGLYGYGVVDGRGNAGMIAGVNKGQNWWSLTLGLKPGQNQNIPKLIMVTGNNFTTYKITMRNAPFYHLHWTGEGFTAWGVKIKSPWNVANTDGINLWGTNATVKDVTISEGDDQIAIDAWKIPAGNITIDHLTGYSRNGLSLGSGIAKGVSNVLIENSNLTGGVVSLNGTTVNGMTLEQMKAHGVTDYKQALPTSATRIRGINIKTRPKLGGGARHVTYSNICMQDLNIPIEFAPYFGLADGTNYPTVKDITFRNIHVLAPTSMGTSRYVMNLQAFVPEIRNQITFDNVVFDDLPSGESSLQSITAFNNEFTTRNNVYPEMLSKLTATDPIKKTVGATSLNLKTNRYVSSTDRNQMSAAYGCPANIFPFAVGDLYLSIGTGLASGVDTNLQTATLKTGSAVTLNAVVQSTMSEITYFAPHAYNVTPGLLAVGAPSLTSPITFYKRTAAGKTSVVGTATLGANGTLASLKLPRLKRGTYHFSASYPGDSNYAMLSFGSVTVQVK